MDSTAVQIAVGPRMPGWGSWGWVGVACLEALRVEWGVRTFELGERPEGDVVVVVKHPLSGGIASQLGQETGLVYCPIDRYGSPDEISRDGEFLRRCSRVVVHSRRLPTYFEPFAPTEYLDHPVRYVAPPPGVHADLGPALWVGVRSNLPPLVEWLNRHGLALPLVILTNPERRGTPPTPGELGFRKGTLVVVDEWSPERHLWWLAHARAAVDIKGTDFRSRHKPPAKAIDFVVSGLPLAMNPGSAPVEHLADLGLEVADPRDADRWLSSEYREETRRSGFALRGLLSTEVVARRWVRLVDEVLSERRRKCA